MMRRWLILSLLSLAPLWAVASEPAEGQPEPVGKAPAEAVSKDPLESFNRVVFHFNGVIDHFLIKPAAEAYVAAMPPPIRSGVSNALGNVSDAWSAVNLMLQGKGTRAAEMTMRVGINTVFGLGGLLDVATEAGLDRQTEDFGQTLGRWGVPSGPYLVLPFFGPSTVRDAAAFTLDTAYTTAVFPSDAPQKWRWMGLRLTDARADALPFTRMLDSVALDKYTFMRDAYLARRRSLIYDGNPPPSEEDEVSPALEGQD
jgi:phospholipid-binding lipoprotein MlaA